MPRSLCRAVVVANGARAALRCFRAQQAGVLVNVASMAGKMAMPYASAYCASKFAIVGFSERLRAELAGTGIAVCTVMPGAIDTPFFQHAANYTGRAVKAPTPLSAPERVADAIVTCARRPERERYVGIAPRALSVLHTLAPAVSAAPPASRATRARGAAACRGGAPRTA